MQSFLHILIMVEFMILYLGRLIHYMYVVLVKAFDIYVEPYILL